jgi:hypothetical protein
MDNVDGVIVLTFHFNGTFNAGENYILSAGSVFGFTDGSSYTLPADVDLYWNGSVWSDDPVITLDYRWGDAKTIQYNTNLPATTPIANFTASENGSNLIQTANQYQNVGWIGMDNVDGTIVLEEGTYKIRVWLKVSGHPEMDSEYTYMCRTRALTSTEGMLNV